jgi:hypothetical protein
MLFWLELITVSKPVNVVILLVGNKCLKITKLKIDVNFK